MKTQQVVYYRRKKSSVWVKGTKLISPTPREMRQKLARLQAKRWKGLTFKLQEGEKEWIIYAIQEVGKIEQQPEG